jgi:hypothetical protein
MLHLFQQYFNKNDTIQSDTSILKLDNTKVKNTNPDTLETTLMN